MVGAARSLVRVGASRGFEARGQPEGRRGSPRRDGLDARGPRLGLRRVVLRHDPAAAAQIEHARSRPR